MSQPDSTHYNDGRAITPFLVAQDWNLDAWTFSAIKYLSRLGRKNPANGQTRYEKDRDDILKAIDCLQQRLAWMRKQEAQE